MALEDYFRRVKNTFTFILVGLFVVFYYTLFMYHSVPESQVFSGIVMSVSMTLIAVSAVEIYFADAILDQLKKVKPNE